MKVHEILTEGVAGPKKCWPGHRKTGTQPGTGKNAGKRVNNCEKIKEQGVAEAAKWRSDPDAYDVDDEGNKTPRNPNSPKFGYDPLQRRADTANDAKTPRGKTANDAKTPRGKTAALKTSLKMAKGNKGVSEGQQENVNENELSRLRKLSGISIIKEEIEQQFDLIEEMVEALAKQHGVDAETIWEDFESVDDYELLSESAAWKRSAGKSKKGGLNAKGVASYRRENPGSKLQMAVTTKPSKLKPGSKAAKRRKSFCARMGGNKGPMKKPNGKPTRKALALRKWNC